MDDDLITLAELVELVPYGGTWVRKLARTDPAFPETKRIGPSKAVSRKAAIAYFEARGTPARGRPPKASHG